MSPQDFDSTARFKIVGQPALLPGKCAFSFGAGAAAGPYLDTGLNIRNHGQIYISKAVLEEMYWTMIKAHKNTVEIGGQTLTEEQYDAARFPLLQQIANTPAFDPESFNSSLMTLKEISDGLVSALGSATVVPTYPSPVDSPNDEDDAGTDEGNDGGADKTPEPTSPASKRNGSKRVSGDNGDDPTNGIDLDI